MNCACDVLIQDFIMVAFPWPQLRPRILDSCNSKMTCVEMGFSTDSMQTTLPKLVKTW